MCHWLFCCKVGLKKIKLSAILEDSLILIIKGQSFASACAIIIPLTKAVCAGGAKKTDLQYAVNIYAESRSTFNLPEFSMDLPYPPVSDGGPPISKPVLIRLPFQWPPGVLPILDCVESSKCCTFTAVCKYD